MEKIDMRIPKSFREICGCCEGRGLHPGCTSGSIAMNRGCLICLGTGWVLNDLGNDLKRLGVALIPEVPDGILAERFDGSND